MSLKPNYKQFNSYSFEFIVLEQCDQKSANSFLVKNEKNFQFKKKFYSLEQLRGGGCCNQNSRSQPYQLITDEKLPLQFSQFMIKHSKIIESKAYSVQNKTDKQQVIISISWFNQNQQHFNTLCFDQKLASQYLSGISNSLNLILQSTRIYITMSGYLSIELLSICNILVRVLYCYYNSQNKKKMNQNFKERLENYLTEFESTFKSTATQCWQFGIELEFEIINIALANIPTKSENLDNQAQGIVQSIAKFQISDQLIQFTFEFAKEILQKFVGKIKNPIQKYEIYCIFESMKWNIIAQIIKRRQIHIIKIQLSNLYMQFIKNSQDWIIHSCWIKMISDFLTYRPIIDMNILFQNERNLFERRQKWKDLIKSQCIEQLPYNINQAKCICFPNTSLMSQRSQFLREHSDIGLIEISEFQQQLMQFDKQPDQQFWQFYINYKQENEKFLEQNQNLQQIHSLFNFIPLIQQLNDYLKSLLEKNKSIIEKMTQQIENLQQDLIDADSNYQFELLDQNNKIQTNTIEMTYVINEINLQINLMIYKLAFITNSLTLKNTSQFTNILNTIRQIYETQFQSQLNLLSRHLIEFLKTKFNSDDSLKHHFSRKTILNPFINQNNTPFQQLINFSEEIFNQGNYYKMIFEEQLYSQQLILAEFITLEQFQTISNSNLDHFFRIFLDEIENNINTIRNFQNGLQNDNSDHYLCQSVNMILKISRQLLNIIKARFYKNQPYQTMEALSTRRQGTLEDEIQNQTDDLKILVQKQKDYIEKILNEEDREQKDLSIPSLINLVKQNINEIANMQIQNIENKNVILKQMAIIKLALMELVVLDDNQFKQQLEDIQKAHEKIFETYNNFRNIDQQQSQRQRDNEFFLGQQNQQNLYKNIDSIAKNLINLQQLIEYFINLFEQRFYLDQDLETRVSRTREQIQQQIQYIQDNLIQNRGKLKENLQNFFIEFAANYDTQIPYIDIYQFLDILQIFDLKDFPNQSFFQDSSSDNEAYLNLIHFYKNFKQLEDDEQFQQKVEYKIKQCLCYNLIKIHNVMFEENLQNFSKKLIINLWIKEKDQRVKQLLQNEELIEIQNQLYSRNLDDFQQEVEQNVKTKLLDFDEYHNQILQEEDDEKKEIFKTKLLDVEKDLDQYLLNISDMQAKLQINISTLTGLRRQFNVIKQQLQTLEQKLGDQDIKIARLMGKKYEELLDIRRKNYLDRMNKNGFEQLYVEQYFGLFNRRNDSTLDIQELLPKFLDNDNQNTVVMLIYGRSGVGKTTTLNKIEQFIWQNQNLIENKKIIPISASLAHLKKPTINLFKEILMQDKYGFNENQFREFKEALTVNNQYVVFLLDSYDEMQNEFKQQNLYITNRFFEYDNKNINKRNTIKLIIFCQKELIKQQQFDWKEYNLNGSQYQTWHHFKNSLMEVELLEFENEQVKEFISQYTKISVLQEIQSFQDKLLKQFEQNQISFFEIQNDSKNVFSIIEENQNESQQYLLNQSQLDKIINYLKGKNQFFNQNQNYNNSIKTLRNNLNRLWSVEKYQSFTNHFQIEKLMKIPYLIKLILEVLPKLDNNFSQKQENFKYNYGQIKKMCILKEKISSRIHQPNNQNNNQGWHDFLKSQQSEIRSEIDKTIKKLINNGFFTQVFNNNNLNDEEVYSCLSGQMNDRQEKLIVIKALKEKQLTIYDFLETLTQAFLEQQSLIFKSQGKIQDEDNFKQDVCLFAESFSLEMIQNQNISIQYKPQGQLQLFQKFQKYTEENWYDKYFHDKDINPEYFSMIRSAMLINQRGDNFSFCHEKVSQFYAAKYIYNLVNSVNIKDSNIEQQFENRNSQRIKQIKIIKQSLINQIGFNLSLVQYKEVFNILKEKVINDKSFRNQLFQLFQISTDSHLIQAASNIIPLLGFIYKRLSGLKLQKIHLQNTSLIGIDFSYTDLSESNFNNVNISDCNFTNSILKNAQWSNIINYNINKEIKGCDPIFSFNQQQQVIYKTRQEDKKFYQLGLENGSQLTELFQHHIPIICFDISSDGKDLAYSQKETNDIKIFNFPDQNQISSLEQLKHQVYLLSFSKQNELLASGDKGNKIIIWNWEKQQIIAKIDTKGQELLKLVFSYNNVYVALHFSDEIIQLREGEKWDKQKKVQLLDQQKVFAFAFSYDQMMALVSSKKNETQIIQLLNLQQKVKERQLIGHQDNINCLLFLSDKRSLISGGDDCFIILWNYQTGDIKGRVQKQTQQIQFLNISQDNRILGYYNQNKSIKFMDLQAFESIHQIKHPSKKIDQILFSKEGLNLVSCNQNKYITYWDMINGEGLKKKMICMMIK